MDPSIGFKKGSGGSTSTVAFWCLKNFCPSSCPIWTHLRCHTKSLRKRLLSRIWDVSEEPFFPLRWDFQNVISDLLKKQMLITWRKCNVLNSIGIHVNINAIAYKHSPSFHVESELCFRNDYRPTTKYSSIIVTRFSRIWTSQLVKNKPIWQILVWHNVTLRKGRC